VPWLWVGQYEARGPSRCARSGSRSSATSTSARLGATARPRRSCSMRSYERGRGRRAMSVRTARSSTTTRPGRRFSSGSWSCSPPSAATTTWRPYGRAARSSTSNGTSVDSTTAKWSCTTRRPLRPHHSHRERWRPHRHLPRPPPRHHEGRGPRDQAV